MGNKQTNLKTSNAIIIDNGSGSIKAGLSGFLSPGYTIRTVLNETKTGTYIGNDLQVRKNILDLKYPMEHGVIKSWDDMEKIWNHLFKELKVEDHPILLTEPPLNPKSQKEKLAEMMFEKYHTPGLNISVPAVLSLYSAGRTTGVVLDCGEGVTHVVPIFEGLNFPASIQRLDLAGGDVTDYLLEMLKQKDYAVGNLDRETMRDLKEKLGFVSIDENEQVSPNIYKLPDGGEIKIQDEIFQCNEVLFKPSIAGLNYPGVHELCNKSIKMCDSEILKSLYSNVILSGGSTFSKSFHERIEKEMKKLAPKGNDVQVIAPKDRRTSAWTGGAIMATMSSLREKWVTKQEYSEHGASIIHKKFS